MNSSDWWITFGGKPISKSCRVTRGVYTLETTEKRCQKKTTGMLVELRSYACVQTFCYR